MPLERGPTPVRISQSPFILGQPKHAEVGRLEFDSRHGWTAVHLTADGRELVHSGHDAVSRELVNAKRPAWRPTSSVAVRAHFLRNA